MSGDPLTTSHPTGAPAVQDSIPLLLERALFIKFWMWLSAVGVIVAVITGAAWFLISAQFIPRAEQAGRDAVKEQIRELDRTIDMTNISAREAITTLNQLEGALNEKANAATAQVLQAKQNLADTQILYTQSSSAARDLNDTTKTVNQIAANPALQKFVSDRFTSQLVGINDQLKSLEEQLRTLENVRATSVHFPTEGFFESTDGVRQLITEDPSFRFCALSTVQITSATCDIRQDGNIWTIAVNGTGRCQVTCLKLK
jgi:hypothetical protein